MTTTRRELLLAALGAGTTALLAGCVTPPKNGQAAATARPGVDFGRSRKPPAGGMVATPGGATKVIPQPPIQPQPQPTPSSFADLNILPRSSWTSVRGPVGADIHPLGDVKHITIHHEGWKAVTFEDKASTIDRLEGIRLAHTVNSHNWADIGYHFVIDRAGRIWEGRSLKFQGAHVANCNENNLGIMVLGDFGVQNPSQAQLDSLSAALRVFKAHYKVPMSEIFTHQEWRSRCRTTNTDCPGRSLQAQMARIRTKEVIG